METQSHILLPNDFSVKSLLLLKAAIENTHSDTLNITMVHGIHLSDSISDLLFFNKRKFISELQTPDFKAACDLVKNKFHSRINSLNLDIIISANRSYFQQYAKGNGVSEIILPADLVLDFSGKRSFDLIPIMKRSQVPLRSIKALHGDQSEKKFTNQVSDLFLSSPVSIAAFSE